MLINSLFLNSLNFQLSCLTMPNNLDSVLNMYYTINLFYTTLYNKTILFIGIKSYIIAYYSFTVYFTIALFLLFILELSPFWLTFLVIYLFIVFNSQSKFELRMLKVNSFNLKVNGLISFSGDLIYFDDNASDAPESSTGTDDNASTDSVESPSSNEPTNSEEPTNSDEIKVVIPSPWPLYKHFSLRIIWRLANDINISILYLVEGMRKVWNAEKIKTSVEIRVPVKRNKISTWDYIKTKFLNFIRTSSLIFNLVILVFWFVMFKFIVNFFFANVLFCVFVLFFLVLCLQLKNKIFAEVTFSCIQLFFIFSYGLTVLDKIFNFVSEFTIELWTLIKRTIFMYLQIRLMFKQIFFDVLQICFFFSIKLVRMCIYCVYSLIFFSIKLIISLNNFFVSVVLLFISTTNFFFDYVLHTLHLIFFSAVVNLIFCTIIYLILFSFLSGYIFFFLGVIDKNFIKDWYLYFLDRSANFQNNCLSLLLNFVDNFYLLITKFTCNYYAFIVELVNFLILYADIVHTHTIYFKGFFLIFIFGTVIKHILIYYLKINFYYLLTSTKVNNIIDNFLSVLYKKILTCFIFCASFFFNSFLLLFFSSRRTLASWFYRFKNTINTIKFFLFFSLKFFYTYILNYKYINHVIQSNSKLILIYFFIVVIFIFFYCLTDSFFGLFTNKNPYFIIFRYFIYYYFFVFISYLFNYFWLFKWDAFVYYASKVIALIILFLTMGCINTRLINAGRISWFLRWIRKNPNWVSILLNYLRPSIELFLIFYYSIIFFFSIVFIIWLLIKLIAKIAAVYNYNTELCPTNQKNEKNYKRNSTDVFISDCRVTDSFAVQVNEKLFNLIPFKYKLDVELLNYEWLQHLNFFSGAWVRLYSYTNILCITILNYSWYLIKYIVYNKFKESFIEFVCESGLWIEFKMHKYLGDFFSPYFFIPNYTAYMTKYIIDLICFFLVDTYKFVEDFTIYTILESITNYYNYRGTMYVYQWLYWKKIYFTFCQRRKVFKRTFSVLYINSYYKFSLLRRYAARDRIIDTWYYLWIRV